MSWSPREQLQASAVFQYNPLAQVLTRNGVQGADGGAPRSEPQACNGEVGAPLSPRFAHPRAARARLGRTPPPSVPPL